MVRLIAILRNPIDRAHSAMIHHIASSGLPKDSDLLALVEQTPPERDRLGLISGGWYAASLEPYREKFGDQLLVVFQDDIDRDPNAFTARVVTSLRRQPVPPEPKRCGSAMAATATTARSCVDNRTRRKL
jgi:hypothetical protein